MEGKVPEGDRGAGGPQVQVLPAGEGARQDEEHLPGDPGGRGGVQEGADGAQQEDWQDAL